MTKYGATYREIVDRGKNVRSKDSRIVDQDPDTAADVRLVARRLGVTEETAAASMETLKAAVVTVAGKPVGNIIDYLTRAKDSTIDDLGDRIFGRRLFPPRSINTRPK